MANDVPSDLWRNIESGVWYRDDPTGSVRGYILRDGFPTSRLPRDADRFRGVRFWWRIDGGTVIAVHVAPWSVETRMSTVVLRSR
jgi:hypothetical protein